MNKIQETFENVNNTNSKIIEIQKIKHNVSSAFISQTVL